LVVPNVDTIVYLTRIDVSEVIKRKNILSLNCIWRRLCGSALQGMFLGVDRLFDVVAGRLYYLAASSTEL
jgi:hypothetical protein